MTGRTPACEDSAAIAERLREIQRARMQAIAGCSCPQRDTNGNVVHTPLCPLRAEPASQMEMAREAIQRARLAPAINSEIPRLGRWGSGDFHTHSCGTGSRQGLLARSPPGSTNPVPQET